MNANDASKKSILSVNEEIEIINEKIEKEILVGKLSAVVGEVSPAAQRHFLSIGYQFKLAMKYGNPISDNYLQIIW